MSAEFVTRSTVFATLVRKTVNSHVHAGAKKLYEVAVQLN